MEKEINIGDLATKEWVKNLLLEMLGERPPVVDPPVIVVPPVVLPKCKRGPTIEKVVIDKKKQITITFDGDDVFDAIVEVSKEGTLINTPKEFKPTGNQLTFTLNETLINATYCVAMKAINCTGESSYTFNGVTGNKVTTDEPCKEFGIITKVEIK